MYSGASDGSENHIGVGASRDARIFPFLQVITLKAHFLAGWSLWRLLKSVPKVNVVDIYDLGRTYTDDEYRKLPGYTKKLIFESRNKSGTKNDIIHEDRKIISMSVSELGSALGLELKKHNK